MLSAIQTCNFVRTSSHPLALGTFKFSFVLYRSFLPLLHTASFFRVPGIITEVRNILGDPELFPAIHLIKYSPGCVSHWCVAGCNNVIYDNVIVPETDERCIFSDVESKTDVNTGKFTDELGNLASSMHKIDDKLKEEEKEISKVQKEEEMSLKYVLAGNFLNILLRIWFLCVSFFQTSFYDFSLSWVITQINEENSQELVQF